MKGLSQAACGHIEDQNRQICGGGTLVPAGEPRPQRQRGALGEAFGQLGQRIGLDSGGEGGVFQGVARDLFGIGTGICSAPNQLSGERQRNRSLRTGASRNPLVGILAGQREARSDKDKATLAAVVEGVHARKIACEPDRREPGFQEIGTEGDQKIGCGNVVAGKSAHSEGDIHRLAQRRRRPGHRR